MFPSTPAPSKSFRRAFEDLAAALRARELWAHLGWQDIKQRYRRSTIGPLWITVGMAVTALALGVVNSALFGAAIATLLPSITTGLILWSFITMLFYATPIMWSMDQVLATHQGTHSAGAIGVSVLKYNPVYHFVEILRAPLVGQVQSWVHWVVVGGVTVVGWAIALVVLRNYRSRVPYWV